jgi:hypothetical protein
LIASVSSRIILRQIRFNSYKIWLIAVSVIFDSNFSRIFKIALTASVGIQSFSTLDFVASAEAPLAFVVDDPFSVLVAADFRIS